MEYLKGLLFILIAAEIILSGYLAYTVLSGIDAVCLTGENCKIVQNSQYSQILGIPLSVIGTLSFLALIILYSLVYKGLLDYNWFLAACIFGTLDALYFIYLQFFVIKALCSNCLFVDFGMILILIIALMNKKNY
jgi:uncharacterized membrane protein